MTEQKIPKDLGAKIGTKKESNWVAVRDKAQESLEAGEVNQEINKALLDLAEKKILEEQSKS